jgi:hypothetical protein
VTKIDDVVISTVFLGLDYRVSRRGPPLSRNETIAFALFFTHVNEMLALLIQRVTLSRHTPPADAEYSNARTGQPTVLLRDYGPQIGNPAKHRKAQSRHIPARQHANELPILQPTAQLARYQIPSSGHP